MQLVAEIVRIVVVVIQYHKQRIAENDYYEYCRGERGCPARGKRRGHLFDKDVTDRAVYGNEYRRYEREREINGYAFENDHCVAAQTDHSIVEYRAVAVEYDHKKEVEQIVQKYSRHKYRIARFMPRQVQRDQAHERDKRQKQPRLGHVEFAGRYSYARKLYQYRNEDITQHQVVAFRALERLFAEFGKRRFDLFFAFCFHSTITANEVQKLTW